MNPTQNKAFFIEMEYNVFLVMWFKLLNETMHFLKEVWNTMKILWKAFPQKFPCLSVNVEAFLGEKGGWVNLYLVMFFFFLTSGYFPYSWVRDGVPRTVSCKVCKDLKLNSQLESPLKFLEMFQVSGRFPPITKIYRSFPVF